MGDITRNISREEIACKCGCGFDTLDYWTTVYAQEACDYFSIIKRKKIVLVSHSGCRCFAWNDHEGGADDSYHLKGRAFDHHLEMILGDGTRQILPMKELYDYYDHKFQGRFGVGLYNSFVHFDTRTDRGPWRKSK